MDTQNPILHSTMPHSRCRRALGVILLAFVLLTAANMLGAQQNIFLSPMVQPVQGGHTQQGNFGLSYTIGEPLQSTLQNGNLMLTQGFEQSEKPLPPVAPAPQTVCSDTAVTFVFTDRIAGAGADQVEWSYDSAFSYSYYTGCDSALKIRVSIGHRDTIWMRSRISGSGMVSREIGYTVLGVSFKPDAPTPPAPVSVASDTPVVFVFDSVYAGFGANQMEWALDSNFVSAVVDTPYCTIALTIPPDSFQLIWLKSKDTISGCVSDTRTTIVIVDTVPVAHVVYDSIRNVCIGTSTTLSIANSDTTKLYYLKINTAIVDSSFGNNTTLNLITGSIDTTTAFIIYRTDTSTQVTTALDTVVMIPYAEVDTPEFVIADSLIFINDISSYFALAENAVKIVYSLTTGGANIDSLNGTLTNITDSVLIVRATAIGLTGCGTETKDIPVKVTDIGVPVTSSELDFLVDSPMIITVTTDTILAGTGGNQIQWSFNPAFTGATTVSSPATINIDLATDADTLVYIRSRHSNSKKVSRVITKELRVSHTTFSAALLDKSKWRLSWNEEFNHSNLSDFTAANKWALNWCDYAPNNCDETHCENHWGPGDDIGYTNHGVSGSDGELSFSNGYALFKATKLTPFENKTCGARNRTFEYKTSNITTINPRVDPSQKSLIEIRCQTPGGVHARAAFWTFCTYCAAGAHQEWDIMENNIDPPYYEQQATQNMKDWHNDANTESSWTQDPKGGVSCGKAFVKQTPCDYSDDWHTYGIMISTNEILFYIDGKETWSHKRSAQSPNYPTNMVTAGTARLMVGIIIDSGATDSTYEMKVDYIRMYSPTATNTANPPQCFQNIQGGVPKTLESPTYNPALPGHADPGNHKKAFVVGAHNNETYNISQSSRISVLNTGSSAKPFYRISQFNTGGAAYLESYGGFTKWWRQKTINPTQIVQGIMPLTTVKDWITPLNADCIYFQGTNNKLNYYKKVNINLITHTFNWAQGTPAIWNQLHPLPDCGGSVSLDNQSRVWFREAGVNANNLYSWHPVTGQLSSAVMNYSDGSTDVIVHSCGCLAFYRDAGGQLRQLSWGVNGNGVWNEITLPTLVYYNSITQTNTTVSIVSIKNAMVLDETNARLYFIGSDQYVYYYAYDFNHGVTGGLHRLEDAGVEGENNTNQCGLYNNALYDLALSNDKNTLYYRGNDGNIWYYFNDRENSFDPAVLVSPPAVSRSNWNKTPLRYGSGVIGRIGLEKSDTGRLFYVGSNRKLYGVDWTNADNYDVCPNQTSNFGHYYSYKTDTSNGEQNTETKNAVPADVVKENMQVFVFPNPSLHTFEIIVFNLENESKLELLIEDINGRKMLERKINLSSAEKKHQLIWDAAKANAGIYFYKVKAGNEIATGKMIKM